MRITIEGVANVEKALSKLADMKGIVARWMKAGDTDEIMNASFGTNFTQQGRPKWAPLSAETKKDRKNRGFANGPILFRTGNLRDEVTSVKGQVSQSGFEVLKTWGADQLRGEEKKKFKVLQVGHNNLPARPMMVFNDKDGPRLIKSFAEFLAKQL